MKSYNVNSSYHIIKDPVHGSMQFTSLENNWIKPFINSENYQRLRHIKQLGLGDWIFPGAVHSRFNHGVGCCYVASQICNKLGLTADDKQTVMLACLLHDIGHGPFSHAFEDIFFERAITHEMWTPFFLADYSETAFIDKFNQLNKDFPLNKTKINLIESFITHQDGRNQLLADIVSSQLDADRLDYLLRDSHFCGVSYGQYDFRWLLHCLAIIKNDGKYRLGITSKGVGVIEHYLMARRLMLSNVYHHGKKHAAEFLLKSFLKCLAEEVIAGTLPSHLKESCLGQFLAATNHLNQQLKQGHNKKLLVDRFLQKHYLLYKKLTDYDIYLTIRELADLDSNKPIAALAKGLYNRQIPKVVAIAEKNITGAQALITEFHKKYVRKFKSWQVNLLNLGRQFYQEKKDPILVIDKLGNTQNIYETSPIIGAISNIKEVSCLVYIDREIVDFNEIKILIKKLTKLI